MAKWNLDQSLKINRFQIEETFTSQDLNKIVKDFVCSPAAAAALQISGTPSYDLTTVQMTQLGTSVRSMAFFDRIMNDDVVSSSGSIRGCFENTFADVTIHDNLREMLLNPDSENSHLFSEEEKREFVFKLFTLLCVGGALCQPEFKIERYLDFTKDLYKELLVLYRGAESREVEVACSVFEIDAVSGGAAGEVSMFQMSGRAQNRLLVSVDKLQKSITTIKVDHLPFW